MKVAIFVVSMICLFGIGHSQEMKEMSEEGKKCQEELMKKMNEFMGDLKSGSMDKVKDKMCASVREMMKCTVKAEYNERPTDAQLETYQADMEKTMSAGQGGGQGGGMGAPFDFNQCNFDLKAIADESFADSDGASAFSASLLALGVASLAALFLSRVA